MPKFFIFSDKTFSSFPKKNLNSIFKEFNLFIFSFISFITNKLFSIFIQLLTL